MEGKSDSVVPVLEFADNVLLNLTPRAKGGELWEVMGWLGSVVLYLCQMPTAQQLQHHLCAVSLPRSLGSAPARTSTLAGMPIESLLLLTDEGISHSLTSLLTKLSTTMTS